MTNIYHPAPVCQFYRLDYDDATRKYRKTTRWNHTHLNAHGVMTNWDGSLCMATAGAIVLDAHTLGAKHASPGGIHDHQSDMLGGIGVDDVRVSWANGWSEALSTPVDFDWADSIYAVRAQHRAMIVGVDYGKVPYDYQVQKGGTFDHAIVIDDYRSSDGRIRRYDPLDSNAVWVPQSAYRAAAEALALRVRGTRARLFVAFSKARPLIASEDLYKMTISGYTPLYTAPNGARAGAVRLATYICAERDVSGLHWYRIISKANGGATSNAGKWFKPNRNTKGSPL